MTCCPSPTKKQLLVEEDIQVMCDPSSTRKRRLPAEEDISVTSTTKKRLPVEEVISCESVKYQVCITQNGLSIFSVVSIRGDSK